jgi:hypothetical protein
MKKAELDRRLFGALIDTLLLIAIMTIYRLLVHIPSDIGTSSNQVNGIWLMLKGLLMINHGVLGIISVLNPVFAFMNVIIDIFTHDHLSVVFWQFLLYYILFEYFFKTTPGKFIFKMKVVPVKKDKLRIEWIFIRTICRVLPIEPISFVFKPGKDVFWHDTLSKTMVVYR